MGIGDWEGSKIRLGFSEYMNEEKEERRNFIYYIILILILLLLLRINQKGERKGKANNDYSTASYYQLL